MALASSALAQLDAGAVLMLASTIVVFIPVLMLFPPVPAGRSDALRQTHSRLGLRGGRESNLRTQYSPAHRLRFPWADAGLRGLGQRLAAKLSRGLRAAPEKDVMLPLEFPSRVDMAARGYEYARVRVWKQVVPALNMESELPPELAVYLGARRRLALFRIDPANTRPVPGADAGGCPPVVRFQDAYPVHMLSLASVRALEARIQEDAHLQRLDVRQFRANIILSGAQEYDEDSWEAVRFEKPDHGASTVFDVSCRTIRCKMPNVNPDTGVRHKSEPDHALRTYRNVDESAPKLGCLGVQLCPVFPAAGGPEGLEGLVEVGMEAQVLRRGSHGGDDQEAGVGLEQAEDAAKEQNAVP